MLKRIAFTLESIAALLVLAAYMLPESRVYWAGFLCLALLWLPLKAFTSKRTGTWIQIAAMTVVAAAYVASPQVAEKLKEIGPSYKVAVSLALAWTFCVFCIEDGAIVGLPLGLLSCIGIMTIRVAETPAYHSAITGTAAAMLICAAALYFHSSLMHPSQRAIHVLRTSALRLVPPIVMTLIAILIMTLTADWVRQHIGKLAVRLPLENNHQPCALEAPAPKFDGRTVCSVTAISGPLPGYLAETQYTSYQDGHWANPAQYMQFAQFRNNLPDNAVTHRCAIDYPPGSEISLTPFGAVQQPQEAAKSTPSGKTSIVDWTPYPSSTFMPLPSADLDRDPELRRLTKVAEELCRFIASDAEKARRIENFLTRNLHYDMKRRFRARRQIDPVEHFMFESKRGWCIHFASAATLLLQAADVPARFVTGYRLAEGSQHEVVLDSYAHAWCEALIETDEGHRWVIVDPSPSPALAAPPKPGLDYHRVVPAALALAIGAILGLRLAARFWRRAKARAQAERIEHLSPESVTDGYYCVIRKLADAGIERPPWLTPREFLNSRVPGSKRHDMAVITSAFERVKYMGYVDPGVDTATFRQALNRLLQ